MQYKKIFSFGKRFCRVGHFDAFSHLPGVMVFIKNHCEVYKKMGGFCNIVHSMVEGLSPLKILMVRLSRPRSTQPQRICRNTYFWQIYLWGVQKLSQKVRTREIFPTFRRMKISITKNSKFSTKSGEKKSKRSFHLTTKFLGRCLVHFYRSFL